MPRGYRSDTLTVAATSALTYVFNANLLPQGGIKDLYIVATGTNNSLDVAISQVVVKLEGVEVVNLTGAQLRVIQEGLFPDNLIVAAGALTFMIPMSFPATMSGIWPVPALVSGIPFGLNVSVEISVTSSSSAGTLQIGWTTLSAPPSYMLKCVKQATGVGLSTTAPVPVNYGGNDIIGVVLANGSNVLTKLRLVSRLPGGQEYQISDMSAAMMLATCQGVNPISVTNPFLYLFETPYKFPPNSYFEYTTGSSGSATDLFAAVQVVDVRPASS